jgi:hypothetical protein
MSSAVVSTSAAQSRPFIFDDESAPEVSCHPEYPSVSDPGKQDENGCPTSGRFCQKWGFSTEQSGKYEKRISHGVGGSLLSADPRFAHITPASHLTIRPAPEMVSSGISALDILTGGLPRGCITEICGPASSGRTSVLLAALSAATRRGECCALIDATDALDPHSLAAARVELDRLLWVRCNEPSPQRHRGKEKTKPKLKDQFLPLRDVKYESEHRLEQVLRATDLLLESGGFGLIALDLADVPPESARRIPLTTWFRFRRAIELTPTILLVIEPQPIAGSCSSVVLQLNAKTFSEKEVHSTLLTCSREAAVGESPARECRVEVEKQNESPRDDIPARIAPSHAQLFTGVNITMELIRSRLDRKPAQSVIFDTRTAWAG